eukprot:scaffold126743_cov41-Prasinocladus_malaysianus.AAC.2
MSRWASSRVAAILSTATPAGRWPLQGLGAPRCVCRRIPPPPGSGQISFAPGSLLSAAKGGKLYPAILSFYRPGSEQMPVPACLSYVSVSPMR